MRKIKRFGVEQLRTSPVSAPENIFKMHFPTRKMTKGLAELVMVGTTGEEGVRFEGRTREQRFNYL